MKLWKCMWSWKDLKGMHYIFTRRSNFNCILKMFLFCSSRRLQRENRSSLAEWLLLFLLASVCAGCLSSKDLLERNCLFIFRPFNPTLLLLSPWCLDWVSCGLVLLLPVHYQGSSLVLSWEWPSLLLEMSTRALGAAVLMIAQDLQRCTSCIMVRIATILNTNVDL